jgi:hypothetical protein
MPRTWLIFEKTCYVPRLRMRSDVRREQLGVVGAGLLVVLVAYVVTVI